MINNKDKIDELFKEGLGGYIAEPSPGLWDRLENRYFGSPAWGRSILYLSVLVLLLAGSGLVAWLIFSDSGSQPAMTVMTVSDPGEDFEMSSHTNEMTSKPTSNKEIAEDKNPVNEPIEQQTSISNPSTTQAAFQVVEMSSQEKILSSNIQPSTPSGDDYSEKWERSALKVFFMSGYGYDASGYVSLKPSLLTPVDFSGTLPLYTRMIDEYAKKYELSVGASFTPSMIFYDPNPTNTGWSAGIDIDYNRSRFHVYAGAGISRFNDKGSWEIRYQSYDSVGYYLNVNSFRVNPESPGQVIFEMTEETVYDSVPHISIAEKTNSYTYLDIPAGIGLTVFERRRLSLSVRTGVKFSLLLASDEPTADFDITGADDIFIDRLVPERTGVSWRFTAGLDASYLLTGRLSMHLEPVFEQYLNAVYVNDDGYQAGKPFVIGVSAKIRYRIK